MRAQELELWARNIIGIVLSNQRVEDFRVELKSIWIEPLKAASRLGAHANAARGDSILWLIGVDEKNHSLSNINPIELGDWYKSVQSFFDGFAPRLILDVNLQIEVNTVVALYFDTVREAPYVVKSSKGGYPEFIVPWREGTSLRAARRQDLLSILVPIRRFASLLDELDLNAAIAQTGSSSFYNWGCLFREEEFYRAIRDGAFATLPNGTKQSIFEAYIAMGRANQRAVGALAGLSTDMHNDAMRQVRECISPIGIAQSALNSFLSEEPKHEVK
jgi:hypothetical protein